MTSNEGSGFNSNGIGLRKITNFTNLQILNQIGFISTIYVDDDLNNATFAFDVSLDILILLYVHAVSLRKYKVSIKI